MENLDNMDKMLDVVVEGVKNDFDKMKGKVDEYRGKVGFYLGE